MTSVGEIKSGIENAQASAEEAVASFNVAKAKIQEAREAFMHAAGESPQDTVAAAIGALATADNAADEGIGALGVFTQQSTYYSSVL